MKYEVKVQKFMYLYNFRETICEVYIKQVIKWRILYKEKNIFLIIRKIKKKDFN